MIDTGGESREVVLKSGGRLVLNIDVRFFALSEFDRDFVFRLIDLLKNYAPAPTTPAPTTAKEALDLKQAGLLKDRS